MAITFQRVGAKSWNTYKAMQGGTRIGYLHREFGRWKAVSVLYEGASYSACTIERFDTMEEAQAWFLEGAKQERVA